MIEIDPDRLKPFLFLIFTLAIYFLPTMIALGRSHHNGVPIVLVNIFLGWTVLGWFWALIWSCMNPPPQSPIVIAQNFQEQPRARDWERDLPPRLPPLRLPAHLIKRDDDAD